MQHCQKGLLEGIELTRTQAAAVGKTLFRLRAPAQARVRHPHGGASSTTAIHQDVEGSTAAPNGDRTQASLAEVEAQWTQAGGAAKTETHGDKRLLTQ